MSATTPQSPPSRRSRGLSFASGKSEKTHRSQNSRSKVEITESDKNREKAHRRLHTKADPSMAMTESQPAMVALEKSTMDSLRGFQHKDMYGNVITDPDLSNPTRHRLERPLDTIRSFEAAIDGTYGNRRISYARTEETSGGFSRRSSYFGAPRESYQNRMSRDTNGYYNQGHQSRPDSLIGSYAGGQYNSYSGQEQPRRRQRYDQRMGSDPALYGRQAQNFYPQQGYQQSNDNVTAASASNSHGTDQWGNSTDPSSVNSSMDRLQQQQQQQQQEQQRYNEKMMADKYGINDFGGEPQLDYPKAAYYQQSQPEYVQSESLGVAQPPQPPPKANAGPSSAAGKLLRKDTAASKNGDKRKSWFKKRFSKV